MKRPRIPYSAEELAFIEARQALSRAAIRAEFVARFGRQDVSADNIKSLCFRRGWTSREQFSPAEDEMLRARYPDTSTKVLATQLGRDVSSVYRRAHALELKKSEAYLASPEACRLRRGDNIGAATRFQKGIAPANKGVKRPTGWSPGRMKETQFSAGQAGWNWKPIGSERVIDGYRYTKVSDIRGVPWTVNWRATHLVQWEAQHGPLPEGHCLKSVDGDRLNVDPANWQSIPRALLPRLNGGRASRLRYDEAPEELKPTIMVVAQLEHAAKARRRVVSA